MKRIEITEIIDHGKPYLAVRKPKSDCFYSIKLGAFGRIKIDPDQDWFTPNGLRKHAMIKHTRKNLNKLIYAVKRDFRKRPRLVVGRAVYTVEVEE